MAAVASSAWDQPGSSAQHGAADDEMLFPPSDASLMRGYLKADLPGGKFWFVLSQVPCRTAPKCPPTHQRLEFQLSSPTPPPAQERLSYFESEDSPEPLGTLRVDEVSSVHGERPGSSRALILSRRARRTRTRAPALSISRSHAPLGRRRGSDEARPKGVPAVHQDLGSGLRARPEPVRAACPSGTLAVMHHRPICPAPTLRPNPAP